MEVINDLLGYNNLKIYQNTEMFNFSLDSVLLPNFITIPKNAKNILDIGTGNAPIPLILSTKTKANIIGVEIQKEVSNLALKSIKLNKLEKQITIINDDINNVELPINHFDIITCNPPFFKLNENSKLNKTDYKSYARHEISLDLDIICKIAKKHLKNGGVLGIVHRPERLTDILHIMRKYNLEPKKIRFIHPKENKEANILLVEGKKNAKSGIKVLNPLISHKEDGNYTEEVQKYFKEDLTELYINNKLEKYEALIKNFPVQNQFPNYPTGCEAVALYTLLNYYKVNVTIDEIIDKLDKGQQPHYEGDKMYGGNPELEFLGNPKTRFGYGVYEKPIEKVANTFKKGIKNITGTPLIDILKLVKKGYPVQVWTSIDCKDPKIADYTWIDKKTNKEIIWKQPFHSLVLIGYNKDKILVSDPHDGTIKEYDIDKFEKAYNFFGRRALYYDEK